MRVGSEGLSLAWLVRLYPAWLVAGADSGKYIAIRRAADALLHHPQGVYTGLSARRIPAYAFTNTDGDWLDDSNVRTVVMGRCLVL
jgi:hypothetical protein